MENRSRLPGEPSLDHPGVPTGRGGHRAGMKPLRGITARLFLGLPALPRKCSPCYVLCTVERAQGGVVHTPGITLQSPGGDSCARVMPGVGPRWGRPGCRDSPRWGRRFHYCGFKPPWLPITACDSGYARCLPGEPDLVRRAVCQSEQCVAEFVPGGCGGQGGRLSVTVV